ncbi:twin-arginine translocation signal domain-containing protein [Candidatus Woesearchaeota archaeon]|nr:twin-arginine translocation signal domain-containing protein [Candidatus Woesearchaeota archaeon]
MQDNKQEKQVQYKQPDEVKPDYTPQRTYEEKSSDRRDFLRKAGTAVVVGLGGILFGKTALADGIDGGIDKLVGDEEGLKRVTNSYDGNNGLEDNEKVTCGTFRDTCTPDYCKPNYEKVMCGPAEKGGCAPEVAPCPPQKSPEFSGSNTDFKKVTSGNYNSTNCEPACPPEYCNPCEPHCNPTCSPSECHPECHPSCSPHTCNPN